MFEKINEVYQPLAILIQKKRERMQITNISFERGVVTTDLKDIKELRIVFGDTCIDKLKIVSEEEYYENNRD